MALHTPVPLLSTTLGHVPTTQYLSRSQYTRTKKPSTPHLSVFHSVKVDRSPQPLPSPGAQRFVDDQPVFERRRDAHEPQLGEHLRVGERRRRAGGAARRRHRFLPERYGNHTSREQTGGMHTDRDAVLTVVNRWSPMEITWSVSKRDVNHANSIIL